MQEREAKEVADREAKWTSEPGILDYFGRGGGGAPLRDASGSIVTDLRCAAVRGGASLSPRLFLCISQELYSVVSLSISCDALRTRRDVGRDLATFSPKDPVVASRARARFAGADPDDGALGALRLPSAGPTSGARRMHAPSAAPLSKEEYARELRAEILEREHRKVCRAMCVLPGGNAFVASFGAALAVRCIPGF